MTQVLHKSIKRVGQSVEWIKLTGNWLGSWQPVKPFIDLSALEHISVCYRPQDSFVCSVTVLINRTSFTGNVLERISENHFSDVVNGNPCTWFLVTDSMLYFQEFQHLLCSGIKLGSSFIEVTADGGAKPPNSLNHPSLPLPLFPFSVSLSVCLSLSSLSFTPPLQSCTLQCHPSH